MRSTRGIAVLVAVGLLLGAAPLGPPELPTADDYARREADSAGLAEFRGGFHGVVLCVALVAAAAVVFFCIADCPACRAPRFEVLPPAEAPRPAPCP